MAQERVQKILAKAGLASRRKAEELITEGQVTINGRVAQLGDKAEMGKDAIKVNGKLLLQVEAPVYLAFHKPKAVISMMVDPQGRPTIAEYLGKVNARLFPIGRLDFNSDGLLLLTNDGNFAQEFQQRSNIPRVYHAKVKGHATPDMIERLKRGMRDGGRVIQPHSVRVAEELAQKSRVEMVFLESGVIDVKKMLELKGFLVERLTRTAIGHLTLRGLEPGHYRFLKQSQIEALLNQPELGLRRLDEEAEKGEGLEERRFERYAEERAAKAAKAGKGKIIVRAKPGAGPSAGPKPRISASPSGDRPAFGKPGPKPRFGTSRDGERPAFAGKPGSKPRINASPSGERPAFGKPGPKPRFGASSSGERPAFGGKPASSAKRGGTGHYGTFRDKRQSSRDQAAVPGSDRDIKERNQRIRKARRFTR